MSYFCHKSHIRERIRKKIEKASPEEIIECYEQNEKLKEGLEEAHDRFYERIASVQVSPRNHSLRTDCTAAPLFAAAELSVSLLPAA